MRLFHLFFLSISMLLSIAVLQAGAQMPPPLPQDDQSAMPPAIEQAVPDMPSDIPVDNASGEPVESTSAAWIVIAGSYPESDVDRATSRRDMLRNAGFDALIIASNEYNKLTNGLLVVVLEASDRNQALRMVADVQSQVADAYAKRLD